MSKLAKKIASIATTLTVIVMMVGPMAPAQALTADELQAQIATLQAQLAALTAQLNTTTGDTTGTTGTTGTYSACAGVTFSRNLAQGSSGADVKCLQQILNGDTATQVAVSGAGSPGSETTYFGGLTKAAVIKWQVKQGVVAVGTGFVGTLTRAKLNPIVSTTGTTGTTLPAGCTSTSGYSPTTGQSCSSGTTGTGTTGTGTTTTGTTTGVAGAMNVALASDNPAAATIVADSAAADGAQSLIPVLKVTLTNAGSAEAKVTQMKFTRSGISADADISQAYLYDGDTQLAEYNSFSVTVLTFTNSAGIVTVPAGGSKTVTLKVDLTDGTASGKTIKFGINAATDIVSTAASVAGSFPMTGNYMSTASASDLGKLTMATTSNSATIDPAEGVEVFKFTLAGSDQNIEVQKIKFTNTGSTAYTDLTNFKLYDSATQIGSTVASADSDKTVTFDLTATPLAISKGVTKSMTVKADIIGGTNRTYKFSVQNMTDLLVYDTQYKVYIKPNKLDSWSIMEGTEATIQTGKLTISRATDSPSGNVSNGSTNVTLAKFKVKATGEDVKITALVVNVYGTVTTNGIYQGKVYYDGSQMGNTTTSLVSATAADAAGGLTTFSFGNTFIVAAGTEKVLEIKGDIKTGAGVNHTAGQNFTTKIYSVTATGKTSLASVTVGSAAGFQLTVSAGTITAALNRGISDWSSDNPTAVAGATESLLASYIITGGAGEGCDITGIALQWASTSLPTDTNGDVQNVKIYKGTKATGVQIGATQGTVTASTTYTFYPSPYISLAAGEQFTLNVYGDVLTGADTGEVGQVSLRTISGTGKVTNAAVDSSATVYVTGQVVYISAGGALTIITDPAMPLAGIVVMGSTGVELAKFKYDASSSPEDIQVTQIIASTTLANLAPTSSLQNITLSATGLSAVVSSLDNNGLATFDLSGNPWVIPAGTSRTLTIKADIGDYPYASSGSYIQIGVATTTYKGSMVGTVTNISGSCLENMAGNAQYVYKTKPTITRIAPSGTLLSDGTIELLKFKVAADAADAVKLYSINLGTILSDNATTTGNLYLSSIAIYDASSLSTVLNDRVAIATDTSEYTAYSGTSTVANSIFGGAVNDSTNKTGDIMLFNNAGTVLKEIGAGTEVTFVVKATVNSSGQYDSVKARLSDWSTTGSAINAIRWGDQVRADIASTYVKDIPTDYTSYSR
ncbi:MAG: peptidoglycan-binding domain-containing protein [Candidatus Pacebacteria bacterium]|nr:peptidoglycan-binding domain-containing protein [Candidatus Paceibacterota bacterium]